MDIEILDQIKKKVPDFVWDSLNEDYSTEALVKIREKYNLEQDSIDALTDIIGLLILKETNIEDLFSLIKKDFNLDMKVANEISLIILREILYPIKDYFPGLEDEILKLGGEIPKEAPKKGVEQFLKREEEMEAMQEEKERKEEEERLKEEIINEPIGSLLKKYPKVGEQVIGAQKEITIKSMPLPMKPMIKYWLSDYREKMGYESHSNIDRVEYVYHDRNTKNMNEEERRQLNLVLKSLDEGISLPYSVRIGKIDFSRVEEE